MYAFGQGESIKSSNKLYENKILFNLNYLFLVVFKRGTLSGLKIINLFCPAVLMLQIDLWKNNILRKQVHRNLIFHSGNSIYCSGYPYHSY